MVFFFFFSKAARAMFTMFAMPQPARALQTGPQELALASLCAVIPSRCHSHGMGPPALRLPLPSLFSPLESATTHRPRSVLDFIP